MSINELIQKFPQRMPTNDVEWSAWQRQVLGVLFQYQNKDGALTDEMPIASRGEAVKDIVQNINGVGNIEDAMQIASRSEQLKDIVQRLKGSGHAEDGFELASRSTAFKDILQKISDSGQAVNVTFNSQRANNYTASFPLGNPLSAVDAGANATINIAAFDYKLPGLSVINYNSGSITGLAYSTKYYVYGQGDPSYLGGPLTYTATTSYNDTNADDEIIFIDTITTPASGGGGTGGDGWIEP